MPVGSFNYIKLNPMTKQKTVTELCKSQDGSFLQNDLLMIDFDGLAKQVGSILHSPDGLALKGDIVHFVEFKNRKLSCKNMISECFLKLYDGLSIFGFLAKDNIKIDKIKIMYTIIFNPEKNVINVRKTEEENAVFGTINRNLERSGGHQISDQDVSNYKKMKDGKFQHMRKIVTGLSKYGIEIEVDALLTQEEIEQFLLQFRS